jgi:UDP-N-acetylmuramoylalanine--D-glutamate ligase
MITARGFEGRTIAVFGLGASGLASARSLAAGGADVVAWDDAEPGRAAALEAGFEVADLQQADFDRFSALVLAPGVPLTHPEPHWTVAKAQAAGIEIIGDIEIFSRALAVEGAAGNWIGITGTNGKSTTTALIGHVLQHAGRTCEIGGNIGTPVLDLAPVGEGRVYVVELSSYQIDLAPGIAPRVAILLNLSPDHLDRHGTFDHYAAVKARLFDHQNEGDVAVIGCDDAASRKLAENYAGKARLVPIAGGLALDDGVFVEQAKLYEVHDGKPVLIGDLAGLKGLRGVHNWQNAAAAFAAARAFSLTPEAIMAGFASFAGLAHRMEQVADKNGIMVVNDSKATNVDAAARALASFENIYWIAGGRAKEGGIAALEPYFDRMVKAYLIGEAADKFAAALSGRVACEKTGTVEKAVAAALADAWRDDKPDAVILFSPACASFDQYRNFELRGEAFKSAVERCFAREAGR